MKPTREQIEAATPEELKVMTGKMMGYQLRKGPLPRGGGYRMAMGFASPESVISRFWQTQTVEVPYEEADKDAIELYLPKWPTDIARAWQVIEWIHHHGGYVMLNSGGREEIVWDCTVRWHDEGDSFQVQAREWDAPLAICRAALLWWIAQEEV